MKSSGFYLQKESGSWYERLLLKMNSKTTLVRERLLGGFLRRIYRWHITPTMLTMLGLLSAIAANIILYRSRGLFVTLLLIYFLFDLLDGASARANKASNAWGTALDDGVDMLIAVGTTLNIGYVSGELLLAALSMSIFLFQEWCYGLLHRIREVHIPIHSYIIAWLPILLGYYVIAFQLNIWLSILGVLRALWYFLKVKPKPKI